MSPASRRPEARLLAALATGLLLAGVGAAPALARQPAAAKQAAALTAKLESISTWTGPATPLRVQVAVTNQGAGTLGGLQVRLLAGGQVTSRSELQERFTAQTRSYGRFVGVHQFGEGVRLAPGASRRLPAVSFELPGDVGVNRAGAVIPVRVEVTAATGGAEPARIDTFAIYVSERVAQPLRMSLVVQAHEAAHRLPDGTFVDDRLARLLAPGGSLGGIVRALAEPDAPPVDLMVDALLVEEATAMSGNGWRLRRPDSAETEEIPGADPRSRAVFAFNQELGALAGRQGVPIYALPYAAADLVALSRNGLGADAAAQLARGRSELEQRLGKAPDRSLAFPVNGVVDKGTMQILGDAGATTVILSAEQVPGAAVRARTPNAPVELATAAGQPRRALVADQALSAALADPQALKDPAERSQRILAETAVTWLEQPNRRAPRGLLLTPPGNWRPSPRLFATLLDGFAEAPWLRLVRAEQLGAEVQPTGKRQALAPYGQRMIRAELPARYLAGIRTTRERLQGFISSAGDGFEGGQELERLLLLAESADYRSSGARARGTRYVRAVNDRIRAVYGQVGIERTPVVLTARQGPLQITAFNRSDVPLTVRLRVSSLWVDATEPISEPFELPARAGHTRRVEVRTRGAGSYPVLVELITADGRQVIGSGSVVVRSTAVARVTLLLIGGAGGFLVVWWARKLLRRPPGRPARRPAWTGSPAGRAGLADGGGPADGPADGRPGQPGPARVREADAADQGAQAPSRSVRP